MEKNRTEKLKVLEADIKSHASLLYEAAQTIIVQNISNYPIFVAHQHTLNMGIELIDSATTRSNWSINASTLEEFATKGIVTEDKIEAFTNIYKNPNEFVCIFLLESNNAEFIFYPYEEQENQTAEEEEENDNEDIMNFF